MNRLLTVPLALGLCLALAPAASADLALPGLSPRAMVMQTVGVTQITVDYSSPGVRDRTIFGELVPHGELWRTGADAATKITLSRDAKVGGVAVKAGTYAMFTIPTAGEWTIILNSNAAQGGTRMYDEKLDVARFKVKPERAPKRERMTFLFANTTDAGTRLDLEWDQLRVSIPVEVDTAAHVAAAIDAYTGASWRPLANAARYQANTVKNHAAALALIDASIAVKETWFNVWVKASILADKGDVKAAYPLAQRAHELGMKDDYYFWRAQVEKALAEWKAKR